MCQRPKKMFMRYMDFWSSLAGTDAAVSRCMRLVSAVVGSAMLLAHSAAALACGEADEPYYVVSEQLPSGDGVPLNAPLIVDLEESANGPAEPHLSPSLTLTVDGSDDALELKAVGREPHLVWVPTQPLAPNTNYEAHFNPGYEGLPDSIWNFTTGDETTPPIALEGELSATLERGIDPTFECPKCFGDCTQTGQRDVTHALVTLPRVKDGFVGYSGQLWLTDNTPYDFSEPTKGESGPNLGHVVSLEATVSFDDDGKPLLPVQMTLPEEDEAYRPCFALRVFDERGDTAIAESFCLAETFPRSSPDSNPVDDEPVLTDHESSTSAGCSFGVASTSDSSAAFALLGLAALTRRRRSRSAL